MYVDVPDSLIRACTIEDKNNVDLNVLDESSLYKTHDRHCCLICRGGGSWTIAAPLI